jgi:hypothetical protein
MQQQGRPPSITKIVLWANWDVVGTDLFSKVALQALGVCFTCVLLMLSSEVLAVLDMKAWYNK